MHHVAFPIHHQNLMKGEVALTIFQLIREKVPKEQEGLDKERGEKGYEKGENVRGCETFVSKRKKVKASVVVQNNNHIFLGSVPANTSTLNPLRK